MTYSVSAVSSPSDFSGGPGKGRHWQVQASGHLVGSPSDQPILWLPACVCVLSRFGCVQLFVTPWTVAHQSPLSMWFSRQEYWSALPCPPWGDLPNPGIKPAILYLLYWQAGSLPLVTPFQKSSHLGSFRFRIRKYFCVRKGWKTKRYISYYKWQRASKILSRLIQIKEREDKSSTKYCWYKVKKTPNVYLSVIY